MISPLDPLIPSSSTPSTSGCTISTFSPPMNKVSLLRYGHFIYDGAVIFSPSVQRKFLDPKAAAIDQTGYAVSEIDS
ncbi:hypothetical protein MA16_Dca011163 [Dendrobium catenatum]|uniref:Uncharacterized protein n=1 Tax=Dendrobium catenatum TaxID=906689 RepID=A0A2I0WSI3_9ASPA|nr:hypothetical protein MA16_Dca011163 [Dendrobium catenatum]